MAYKISRQDIDRIRRVIGSLDPKVVEDWMAQKTINLAPLCGFDKEVPLTEQDLFCTVEGLIKQSSKIEGPVGLIYHITNERTMDKMAVQMEYVP